MPRGIPNSRYQDAAEVAQRPGLDIPTTGSIDDIKRTDLQVEIATPDMAGDYAAQLAFMEEKLDVIVHESTDKNADPIVEVWCNGTPQRFVRGQVQTVKRKFVQILADSRETSIQTKNMTGSDGEVMQRINKHTALCYPFSVASDPSGQRGALWLKQALAAA
jgi:hypothetical protein